MYDIYDIHVMLVIQIKLCYNDSIMKKTISFRANDSDMDIIERFKMKEGGTIRKVSDADVLRHALKLLDSPMVEKKKDSDKNPYGIQDRKFEMIGGIPHIGGVPQAVAVEMATPENNSVPHETQPGVKPYTQEEVVGDVIHIPQPRLVVPKELEKVANEFMGNVPQLTEEEQSKGYQYLKGELCDAEGFPVEQLNGDYVRKNGEIYATDPGRAAIKETAKANSEAVVEDTEFGRVNPAMAELLGNSEKSDSIRKHSEPGMLSQEDGVDEDINEDNFIN